LEEEEEEKVHGIEIVKAGATLNLVLVIRKDGWGIRI